MGIRFVATFSRFADNRLAEIFLSSSKNDSQADAIARDSAVLCSLALQHGAPLATIRRGNACYAMPEVRLPRHWASHST